MIRSQTFKFSAENADGWYKRLNEDQKKKYGQFINAANSMVELVRLNGLPEPYLGSAKKIEKRVNADPSTLTDEQVFALDSTIAKTMYNQNTWAQISSSITRSMSGLKWTSKNYKIDEDDTWPKLDQTFRKPRLFTIGVEPEQANGTGISIGYEIPWTEIAQSQGGLYSPEFYYAMVASERMGILADEMGFNGTAAEHAEVDAGIKGAYNHASNQTFSGTTLTTYGNIVNMLYNALSDMKSVYQDGKVVVVLTSGLASQLYYNRQTYTNKPEIDYVSEYLVGPGKPIQEIWVSDRLLTLDPTNSNQAGLIMKMGPTTMARELILPLQTKPMQNKTYAEDIKEVLLYGDLFKVYGIQTHPISKVASLSTTDTGFLPNGRLL